MKLGWTLCLVAVRARVAALSCMAAAALSVAGGAQAQVVEYLPNLKALPASNLSLGSGLLRFSTTSWNSGTGPLELVGGDVTGPDKQKVLQRVYNSGGSYTEHLAGEFTYHADHNHIHFDDYALYTLQRADAPGQSDRYGSKTTFCVMDTTKVSSLPGAPSQPVYSVCGRFVQGMSVGWGDTYGAHLSGQWIVVTDVPDGTYRLRIDVDPKGLLREANETDNASCVLLSIKQPNTLTVLDNSGSCATVPVVNIASISPSTVPMGFGNWVTITGSGFAAGMTVSFEGGTGPRPTVSNVNVVSGTRVDAFVTIANKKQLGKNPVWEVRVGNGFLADALRVSR
jgi:hypothetical protein